MIRIPLSHVLQNAIGTDDLQLSRENALSLRASISSALRETRAGGRPQQCFCGVCHCVLRFQRGSERAPVFGVEPFAVEPAP